MLKGGYQIIRFNPNIEITENPVHVMFSYYDASHSYQKMTRISGMLYDGQLWDDFNIVFDRSNPEDLNGNIKAELVNGLLLLTKLHITSDSMVYITKEMLSVPESFVYREFRSGNITLKQDTTNLYDIEIKVETLYNTETNEAIILNGDIINATHFYGNSYTGATEIVTDFTFDFIPLNSVNFIGTINLYTSGNLTTMTSREIRNSFDYDITISNTIKMKVVGFTLGAGSISECDVVFNEYSAKQNSIFYTKNTEVVIQLFHQITSSVSNQIEGLPFYFWLKGKNGNYVVISNTVNLNSVSSIRLAKRTITAGKAITQTNQYRLKKGTNTPGYMTLFPFPRNIPYQLSYRYTVNVKGVIMDGLLKVTLNAGQIIYTNTITAREDMNIVAGTYPITWISA